MPRRRVSLNRPGSGIRRTAHGWQAYIRVHGRMLTKHFPPSTRLTTLKAWRDKARTKLKFEATYPDDGPSAGTFREDAARYLASVRTVPTYQQKRQHLLEWALLFGDRRRASITSHEIAAQLHRWHEAGAKNGTVNKRRTSLMAMWTRLDGRGAANPVRDTPVFREPDAEPRGLSYETVDAILASMPPSKTRARLAVIAWTGLPHSTVMRLRPGHLDDVARSLLVPGREKGKGTKARRIPLSAQALEAFTEFDRWDAWGAFSTSSMYKSFQTACRKLALTGIRPYDFRHSFGTAVYQQTGDIRATQALLGHSSSRLTERYTLGAVDTRMAKAVEITFERPKTIRVPKKVARKVASAGGRSQKAGGR